MFKCAKSTVVAVVACLLFSAPVIAVDDLSLNVSGATTRAPGQTVTVALDVANLSAAINGVQVRLQYNTSLLTLVDVVPTSSPAAWTEISQSATSGNLDWAAVINGGSTSADHTIANLTFTVIAEGTTSITFRSDADPFYTKLTRASDSFTILPNKANSQTLTLTCNDGVYCNGLETFSGGSCQPGTDPCNDSIVCTVDSCNEATDTCTNTPNNALCDDAAFCNGVETCSATLGCQAGTPPCNDSIACTVDTCNETTDTCTYTPNDGLCSDGLFCNGTETCSATLGCQAGTFPCGDGVGCTNDTCNETTDTCTNTPINGNCDDGLFCNGAETCHPTLDCQPGTPPCNDGIACTTNSCTEATDTCTYTPNNALCDDSLYCNGAETCSATLGCQAGTPPCNDSIACTVDTCDEPTDTCTYTPNNALCDNGAFCDGAETCSATLGCQAGTPPCNDSIACTVDTCTEATDTCTYTPNNGLCNDGLFCNGVETCSATLGCQSGTPPCDDAIACTVDTCNESNDTCTFTPNNALCDNGAFCDGAETCSATLGCQAGTPPCNDSIACTVDTCTEATDTCTYTPNNALCDNGAFCDGAETCSATLGCQAGTPPCNDSIACTVDTCDEPTDTCTYTPNNALCDNGAFCDGAETCSATLGCQAGTPPCNDSIACTVDTCTEATDTCTYTPNNALCDDALYCNGAETCSATLGCQPGADPCDDGILCTVDSCNESTDTCGHAPNNALCSDGLYCNGAETCNAALGCEPGTNPCIDGVDCTVDTCNESTDVCTNTPNHAFCSDGLFCNGAEICDPVLDCVDGADPCQPPPTEFCNETTDACDDCVTPGDCDDSNVCTSDACNAGACVYTNLYNPATHCCNPTDGSTTVIDDGDPCTTDTCNPGTGVVTHADAGEIDVNIKIQGLNRVVTRDVTFVVSTCGGSPQTIVLPVSFNAFGIGAATLVGVDADADYLAVTEGHTLRRLSSLSFLSCIASVDLSGGNLLMSGDFSAPGVPQDNLCDIVDFSILASRWNVPISANSSSGADANGDGVQNTADFTAIQANYFDVGDGLNLCAILSQDEDGEIVEILEVAPSRREDVEFVERVAVSQLFPEAEEADMNEDGFVDAADILEFARLHKLKLTPDFERRIQGSGRAVPSGRRGR